MYQMIWGGFCTHRFAAMVSSKGGVWPQRDWPSTRTSRWCGFDLWKIYKFVFVFELAIWTSMNEQINLQIAKSLERVKSSVDYWDSSKCPPVRWTTILWLLLSEFWSKYCSLIGAFQMIEKYFSGRTCRILGWFLQTMKIYLALTLLVQGFLLIFAEIYERYIPGSEAQRKKRRMALMTKLRLWDPLRTQSTRGRGVWLPMPIISGQVPQTR